MKYEKCFKAYKFFFIILSLYKQFICKHQLTLKSLLNLGQNVITFRTLLHLGSFITFRPSTPSASLDVKVPRV